MKFNIKYLILPLSIIGNFSNIYVQAMDSKENPNKIISYIKKQIKNDDFLEISDNNEIDIKRIKERITKKITDIPSVKFLINRGIKNTFEYLSRWANDKRGKCSYTFYYKYDQILDLLKSFNSFKSNKPFTIDQLTTINDIVKTINFFVQKDEEYKKQGLYHDYNVDYVISDYFFGIGLIKNDENNVFGKCIFIQPNNDYYLFEIQKNYEQKGQYKRNKHKITNESFRNFLDAVKLCSMKKLPIIFEDKYGRQYNNPYLITRDEYKNLLTTLMKDFWISFYGEYKHDILDKIYIMKDEEELDGESKIEMSNDNSISIDDGIEHEKKYYTKLKNRYDTLEKKLSGLYSEYYELLGRNRSCMSSDEIMKYNNYEKAEQELHKIIYSLDCYNCKLIVNAFENDYNENNFIQIFGKETIENIRYIIHHLINIEMNNNGFKNKLNEILSEILSKEQDLYKRMRRGVDKVVNEIIDKLKKQYPNFETELEQKVWTNNIYWSQNMNRILKNKWDGKSEIEMRNNIISIDDIDYNIDFDEYDDIEIKEYKLHSKERVENYLKKLFYDKVLDTYLRQEVFKYIMKSSNLSKDIKDNPVLNENHNIYLSNIKSHYILNNILKYVPLKKQKDLFFGLAKKDSNSEDNKNINIINDIRKDNFCKKSFINKKMK